MSDAFFHEEETNVSVNAMSQYCGTPKRSRCSRANDSDRHGFISKLENARFFTEPCGRKLDQLVWLL